MRQPRIFWILLLVLISCTKEHTDFDQQKALSLKQSGWDQLEAILENINPPEFSSNRFAIVDFGGKGDSLTDNVLMIQEAIETLFNAGGGTLVFPPGEYLCNGPIHLKSGIQLEIQEGARIFFGSDPERYLPAVKVRWEGTICYNFSPLIYGYRLEDISITGKGIIDGNAVEWSREWRKIQNKDKELLRQMGNDTIPDEQRIFGNGFLDLDHDGMDDGYGDGQMHFLRPTLIELYKCENIEIRDLTLRDGPFWTVHPVFSKNVTIKGLNISGEVLNDDGIDPDSCEDVLIENCTINTHDDAISIKAGRDQDAWFRPGSRNIIVRNNRLMSGVNAICIGSEMSGGVENVFVYDNHISNGKHALNFKCNLDRGGEVKNIFIDDIEIDACSDAMFIFRMDYHGYRGNHFPTKFSDFFVSNITCGKAGQAFKIVGVIEAPIKRVMFQDVLIQNTEQESEIEFAEEILFENVIVNEVLFF